MVHGLNATEELVLGLVYRWLVGAHQPARLPSRDLLREALFKGRSFSGGLKSQPQTGRLAHEEKVLGDPVLQQRIC